MSPAVTVSVPAHPRYVQIVRTVLSGVAARLDFPYDAIEDLKILVDEACAQLLPHRPETLTVAVRPWDDRLEVTISADVDVATWPPDGAERTLAWQVLNALADEAAWERADGSPALRLAKATGGGA